MRKLNQKTPSGLLMPDNKLIVGGTFFGQIVRDGAVIDEFEAPNRVVNQGLNSLLNVYLGGDAAAGAWYLGLFQGNYTPVATVTAATIVAAATECTDYDETTRPAYSPAAAASQAVTNSASRAVYTFNASRTIYGAFLVSENAKSSGAGVLFSAARFATAKAVTSGDQLLLTYNFSALTA